MLYKIKVQESFLDAETEVTREVDDIITINSKNRAIDIVTRGLGIILEIRHDEDNNISSR